MTDQFADRSSRQRVKKRARAYREDELILEVHGLAIFVPTQAEPSITDEQNVRSGHIVLIDAMRAGSPFPHTPALVFDSQFLHPDSYLSDLTFIIDPTMLDSEDRNVAEPRRDRQWAVWPLYEKTVKVLRGGHSVPTHRGDLRVRCMENLPDLDRIAGIGRIRRECLMDHPPRPHPHAVAGRLELTTGLVDACATLDHVTSFSPKHQGRCYARRFARHLTYRTSDPQGIFELEAKRFGSHETETLVLAAGADGPVRAFLSNVPAVQRTGGHMRSFYALGSNANPTPALPYRNSNCVATIEPEGDGIGCSPAKADI